MRHHKLGNDCEMTNERDRAKAFGRQQHDSVRSPLVSETTFRRYRCVPVFVLVRPNGRCTDPLACSYGRKALKPRTFLQERRRSA